MNDHDSLSALLRIWRHEPREAPRFNHDVWARLRAAPQAEGSRSPLRFLHLSLDRGRWAMPIAASATLLLSLAAGSGAALAYSSLTRDDRMATEYARSIDPLQMIDPHLQP